MAKRQGPANRAERIKDNMLSAIAIECGEYCETVSDLHECLIHPKEHPEAKTAVPRIRRCAKEQLVFISQAIEDLKSLESRGVGIPAGKR